jgi:hypothetical protein
VVANAANRGEIYSRYTYYDNYCYSDDRGTNTGGEHEAGRERRE